MSYLDSLEQFNNAMESAGSMAEQIKSMQSLNRTDKLNALTQEYSEIEGMPTASDLKIDKITNAISSAAGGVSGVLNTIHSFKLLQQKLKDTAQEKAQQLKQKLKPDDTNKSSDTTEGTEANQPEIEQQQELNESTRNPAGDDYVSVEERYQNALREQQANNPETNQLNRFGEQTEEGDPEAISNTGRAVTETAETTTETAAETTATTTATTAETVATTTGETVASTIEGTALEAGALGAGETLGTSLLVGGIVAGVTALGTELYSLFRPHHHKTDDALKQQINNLQNQAPDLTAKTEGIGFGFTSSVAPETSEQELV